MRVEPDTIGLFPCALCPALALLVFTCGCAPIWASIAQRLVVVAVLVAGDDGEDALRQHGAQFMFDAAWIAPVGEAFGQRIDQPQRTIRLAHLKESGVRSDVPALEVGGHGAALVAGEGEFVCGTLCHREWPWLAGSEDGKNSRIGKTKAIALFIRPHGVVKFPG